MTQSMWSIWHWCLAPITVTVTTQATVTIIILSSHVIIPVPATVPGVEVVWHSVVRSLIRTRICDPMNCSMPGSFVLQYLPEFAQIYIHRVGDATQPFCPLLPLLLLPSVFPIIRVFSSEPTLHIGWPNYWSFSFSRSPSSEYSGLISFRIDSIDLLAVQGTLKSFLQHHSIH